MQKSEQIKNVEKFFYICAVTMLLTWLNHVEQLCCDYVIDVVEPCGTSVL